jgi:hypothetical protein
MPKLTPLFNDEYDVYTDLAEEIDSQITKLLKPIFENAVKENLSLRDLHFIISSNSSLLTAEYSIRRSIALKKKQREEKI